VSEQLWQAVRAARAAGADLLAIPGVHLVALGSKEIGGRATGEPAIRVHVEAKRAAAEVPAAELIPAEIDGVRTDVLQTGATVALAGPPPPGALLRGSRFTEQTVRPVVGGAALMATTRGGTGIDPNVDGGVLGCLLWDPTDHDAGYALTAQHVVDSICVPSLTKDVTRIGQPTGKDSCSHCCSDVIGIYAGGELDRAPVPDGQGGIRVATLSDQAAVRLNPGTQWKAEILDIGPVTGIRPTDTIAAVRDAVNRIPVRKRGARTGLTGGVLTDAFGSNGAANFILVIQPNGQPDAGPRDAVFFADHSDSGSVVVDDQNRIVGLIYARARTFAELAQVRIMPPPTPPEGERVPVFAWSMAYVLSVFAQQTPPLVLEVAVAGADNPVHTVPDPGPTLPLAPELVAVAAAEPAAFLGSTGPSGELRVPVGRPWFAGDHGTHETVARLREWLDETEAGRVIGRFWTDHERELRDLLARDRRVQLAWHRGGGAALVQLLLRMAGRPELALPETIGGVPVAECLDQVAATFAERGSPALAADVRRVRALLPDPGGRTLAETMVALGAVRHG
jgi:hypothetical protein